MTRFLYIRNTETGEETGHVEITDMKPMDIIVLEQKLWAQCDDPCVVRDSADD